MNHIEPSKYNEPRVTALSHVHGLYLNVLETVILGRLSLSPLIARATRILLSFCKCSLFTLDTQISIFGQPDSFVWCSDEGFNSSFLDIVTSNEERRGELFAANRGSRLVKPRRRSSKTGRGALHAWT